MCREKQIDYSKYKIFENGKIFSNTKNKFIAVNNKTNGYVYNNLILTNGKKESFGRHRVIWYYFNGNIPKGYDIDHINGDKTDNRIENLRCVTRKENMNNPITKEKMINIWSNLERNKKISESNKGHFVSEEQKKKQSLSMSGENHPFWGKKRPNHSQKMKKQKRDKYGRFIK